MARQPATTTGPKKPPARRRAAKPAAVKPAVEVLPEPPPPPLPEPEPVKPRRGRIGLPHVEAASTRLRTVLLNFAFVAAFLVLVPVIISQFWRDEVLIDTIPVPGALAEIGLTPEVAANRLWDGIRDATLRAKTSKDSVTALPDSRRVEFSLPETGFSMESLIQQARAFFHAYQTRISGEITCGDPACDPKHMKLRLRVLRETSKVIDMPAIGETPLRDYFTAAAVQVLTVLDPFIAIASISETEPVRAAVLAKNMIRQHHPDAKWAHVLLGIMKQKPDETAASIAEFREALKLDPNFYIARRNLAARLVVAGNLAEAHTEYAALEKGHADEVEVIAGKGELALAEKRYDDAAQLFARATALDPRQPLYVARQGDVALAAGDEQAGVTFLNRASEMDPGFVPALASLTAYYFETGQVLGAEKVFADYAEIAPEIADAQGMYGQVLRFNNKPKDGLVYLLKAQALEPKRVDVVEAIGSAYMEMGDLPGAISAIEAGLKVDDKYVPLYAQLGKVYNFMGERDKALENFGKAVELEPTNVAYVAGLGEVLMYAKRYDEALAQFDKALQLEPKRPETWSFKGATLKYMQRYPEAVEALNTFLDLTKDQPFYDPLREVAEDDLAAIKEATP